MNTSTEDRRIAPIWDVPTRLFHWSLAGLIAFAWWSAEEHHYEWHMWAGYAVLTLLLFRLLWGIVGSSTARFSSFLRGPRALIAYLRNWSSWRSAGHTPLGALSVIALLGLTALEVFLGLIAVDEDGLIEGPLAPFVTPAVSEAATELHEELFDVLLVLIGLHVAAILFYRVVLGKKLLGPMITGRGKLEADVAPMRPARGWVAVICLVIAIAITRWVIAGVPPFGG